MSWKITTSVGQKPEGWLKGLSGDDDLYMTYCISKKNKTKQTRFPSHTNKKKTFICVSVRVCVCLDLVLLLVRWVSVKRITTVSLLYPHTLSQRPTFTRPTFHSMQPPSSAPFYKKNLESYLECQGQRKQPKQQNN